MVWYGGEGEGNKFIIPLRKYLWVGGGMKQCLLRSRPPVSEIEIELERTWGTSRVGLDTQCAFSDFRFAPFWEKKNRRASAMSSQL